MSLQKVLQNLLQNLMGIRDEIEDVSCKEDLERCGYVFTGEYEWGYQVYTNGKCEFWYDNKNDCVIKWIPY